VEEEVGRFQREVHPLPEEADAAVARAVEEVRAEEGADVGQDLGRAGRVQAVAAVVEAVAGVVEAAGVAADGAAALEERDGRLAVARQAPGRADARGTAAEDRDARQARLLWRRSAQSAKVADE
jgi:hypothetical protein